MAAIAARPEHTRPRPTTRSPATSSTPWGPRARATSSCSAAAVALFLVGRRHLRHAAQGRPGARGLHPAGLLVGLHHDLRLLGRHRPRRHADLGDPVPVPLAVAHRGVPRHRGDDGLRGHDRRALPDHPHRAPVVLLLAAALSQPALALAQLQVAAGLGRVRHLAPTSRSRPPSCASAWCPTSPPRAT